MCSIFFTGKVYQRETAHYYFVMKELLMAISGVEMVLPLLYKPEHSELVFVILLTGVIKKFIFFLNKNAVQIIKL